MSETVDIVTIDGPSGVGKSTVSRRIAARLGYTYLDTGAMYRGVAFHIHRKGINIKDEQALAAGLKMIRIELLPAQSEDGDVGVVVNGEDVSTFIRTPEMSMIASAVSAIPAVRSYLTYMQRGIAGKGGFVAEGRDVGTVVFPRAMHKFYLDAKAEKRSRRRVSQLHLRGVQADEAEILRMILERDKNDSERAIAPLKKADDAFYIDTTDLTIDQVCGVILSVIDKKRQYLSKGPFIQ